MRKANIDNPMSTCMVNTIQRRKSNWIWHTLVGNYLQKTALDGRIEGEQTQEDVLGLGL